MSYTPNTNRQIPDSAILDKYNKQAYLGNQFSANTTYVNVATAAVETPIMLIKNPSANSSPQNVSLFQHIRKLIISAEGGSIAYATFRVYINPTIATNGTSLSISNLRTGSANTTVMNAYKSPTVGGTIQVQTVTTVADVAGSLNNTYFLLSDIISSGAEKKWYMWFNVNSAGTDPSIAGRTGIQVALATGATANAVATAMRTALNALSTDFVATGAANSVIITNINAGACAAVADGAQPTGFAFANTTPGAFAFGTLISTVSSSLTTIDSEPIIIIDPGSTILITAKTSANNTPVAAQLSWYEL